ncbi:MAG TPA: hypothetical protein VM452_07440 [Caulifigura sp.]|nr:hypothetical protein [Caulifigura sp.]
MPSDSQSHALRTEHSNGRVKLLILIAMVLGTVRLYESAPLQSANDRSRWATVYSLVHYGTYRIDEIRKFPGWDTIDKVRLVDEKGEPHFYSSKPPLFSTIVAGGYQVLHRLLRWTIDPRDLSSVHWISVPLLFLINILPTALALGCLASLIRQFAENSFTRSFVLGAACFGTLWSAYLPSLNNHTPAVCCVIFALRAAIVTSPLQMSAARFAIAGFMAGLAVTFELPAAAFLAGLTVLSFKSSPRLTLFAFLPAAIIPLAAFLALNVVATGDWKPAYASHSDPNGPYHFYENGIPSYWIEPKGLDRNVDELGSYFFHCIIGHHGILSLTPVFLLSIVGLMRFHKPQFSTLAPWLLLGALLTVIVLGFYLAQEKSRNYGGVSVGLRWMLWLIPFWLLMMVPAVDLLSGSRSGQGLLLLLMAPSVFSAWFPFDAPWRQPWIFQALDSRGKLDRYREPSPQFEHPRQSWISQLPTSAEVDPDYWIEMAGAGADGVPVTLRVSDGGPISVDGKPGRRVDLVWNQGRPTESVRSLVVNVNAINAGEDIDPLLWPDGTPAERELVAATAVISGVPVWIDPSTRKLHLPEYACLNQRYRRTALRRDAFFAELAVGSGAERTDSSDVPVVNTYSECWTSAEVPFGVLSWDIRTTNGATGAALSERRMATVRAGKFLKRLAKAEK